MEKKLFNYKYWLTNTAIGLVLTVVYLLGCKEETFDINTTYDVNMTQYFANLPEEYSEFSKVLKLTGNQGFLGAYGLYTCFAPVNEAFYEYYQEKGGDKAEDIDINELKDLVRFHLLQDTISTKQFTDGKLSVPTMYGQYLITGASNVDGATKVRINRQANVIEGNIKAGNGIIHSIDHVLKPATLTLAQMIEQNPDYSIFTEALKKTSLYDTLNQEFPESEEGYRRWLTVIAQSNEAYAKIGVNSYTDLDTLYSSSSDPSDPTDSLYLYMSYHILEGLKYLADIVVEPSHRTLAPLEVITTKLIGDTILINEDVFNGILEKGVAFNREESDYSSSNGVLHSANGNFYIKVRVPAPVYWDVADQPELRLMTDVYRKPNMGATLTVGQLEDVTWEGSTIGYWCESPEGKNSYFYGDLLDIYLRGAVTKWIEFKTPLLVKGKYKVWICYRTYGGGELIQTFFDDEPMTRQFSVGDWFPSSLEEGAAEAQGAKMYVYPQNTYHNSRLAGIIDVKTTDRHRIKFVPVSYWGRHWYLDMIQFIPVDEDQQWPRFSEDGTIVEEP